MRKIKDVFQLIKNYGNPKYSLFFIGLLTSIISSIISIFLTYYIKNIINDFSSNFELNKYIYLFIFLILMNIIFTAISDYLLNIFGYRIVKFLRINIFEHILRLKQNFYDNNSSGEIASHIISDTSMLSYLVSDVIPEAINGFITIFLSIIVMFYLSKKLSLAIITIFPILLLLIYPLLKCNESISEKIQLKNANLINSITLINENSIVTKSYNAEEKLSKNISSKINDIFQLNKKQSIVSSIINPLISITLIAIICLIILYGFWLIRNNEMTIGTLGAYLLFLLQLNAPMINIITLLNNFSQSIGTTSEIISYLQKEKELTNINSKIVNSINHIKFDNVYFKYENQNTYTLKNINFDIKKDCKNIIIGKSGAGKSSLVKLLMKIYDIQNGNIYINDIPISNLNTIDLRNKISYVSQKNLFYDDNFSNNILLSDNCNEIYLKKLLSYLDMDHIITDYEKIINNSQFSGGELQRLGIIRSLVKNADVYIFDEITSNLDRNNVEKIMKIINYLSKEKIVIMITHDYSILTGDENILKID